jgi:hypothetical protein
MDDPSPLANDTASLTVRVARSGKNFSWELHRDGVAQKVKYSAPIYLTEESAMAAGSQARELYLARLQRTRKRVVQPPA